MSNLLASYFKSDTDLTDAGGRSFFDIISECKNFNERDPSLLLDDDKVYDIWPISDKIKKNETSANENTVEFQFSIHDQLNDPIKQLVIKHLGSQEISKRQLPNADSVVCDVNGLQILIKCGCFRSVINLTHKILRNLTFKTSNENQKPIISPYSLQLWFVRIAVLMKLKLYKEADLELKQFENFEKSELFYEYQTRFYPDRKGSMVPFGLRMLNAELPQYINKPDESISKLYELLNVVQEIINDLVLNQSKESALKIWHERKIKCLFSIINILILKKNYERAIELLIKTSEEPFADKCSIWSTIGKLFVQLGDIKDASDCFFKAQSFSKADSINEKTRNLLNLSLLKIANSQYSEAYDILKQANSLQTDNSIIINNMAFCLFYSGNLSEAINQIEDFINRNKNKNMINESLIFNLCTLYELESAKALQKKLNLLNLLNIYAGDGFFVESLQLN